MRNPITLFNVLFVTTLSLTGCSKQKTMQRPPPLVKVAKVLKKSVNLYSSATGYMQPIQSVSIQAQVDGQITNITYKEGDYVKKGTLLMQIDKSPYLADKKQAEGMLLQNRAKLKYASDTLARNKALARDSFISQDTYEKLEADVVAYEGAVTQNLGKIDQANVYLNYCDILSPINGLVGQRLVDVGNIVNRNQAETLVTINQVDPIWVNFSVPEVLLPKVLKALKSKQAKASVYLPGQSRPIATAPVDFIDNEVSRNTGMITLKATLGNEDLKFWPGQYVSVRLITGVDDHALLIPAHAVQESQKGPFVYVVTGTNQVQLRNVTLGQLENDLVIVEKGLMPGERVITDGQVNVHTGSVVTVKNEQGE